MFAFKLTLRILGIGAGAWLTLCGCADSTLTAKDAGRRDDAGAERDRDAGARAAPDAGGSRGLRVKPRIVTVELPPIASRSITAGPDGGPVYGPIVPLDGAKVCVVRRRDAFAAF